MMTPSKSAGKFVLPGVYNNFFNETLKRLVERLEAQFSGHDAQRHYSSVDRGGRPMAEDWADKSRRHRHDGDDPHLALASEIISEVWGLGAPISVGQEAALQDFYKEIQDEHAWRVRIGQVYVHPCACGPAK